MFLKFLCIAYFTNSLKCFIKHKKCLVCVGVLFSLWPDLLWSYFHFQIWTPQNFCLSYFLGKCGPKIWNSLNWLKFGTRVHCYMLIGILMFTFFKTFVFLIFWANWAPNLKFSKLTKIWFIGTLITICLFQCLFL